MGKHLVSKQWLIHHIVGIIVALVIEAIFGITIGAIAVYCCGPRRNATIVLDVSELPIGTTINIVDDRCTIEPMRGERLWHGESNVITLDYDGESWKKR